LWHKSLGNRSIGGHSDFHKGVVEQLSASICWDTVRDGVDCETRARYIQVAHNVRIWPDAELTAIRLVRLTRYKLSWNTITSKIEKLEWVAWVGLLS